MPSFVKLATLDELPPGSMKEVEVEGLVIGLFNVGGEISAMDGICPHQGGPLVEGDLEGCKVTCPWHGWEFDVRTGRTSVGPKIVQTIYPVKISENDILVEVP